MEQLKCETCDNSDCFLKKYCLPDWLPLISLQKPTLHFKKGEVIFQEGDPVSGIYFIYSGKVKVHKKWDSDEEYIVRLAKRGDILGHRGFGGQLIYPISATALEDCTINFIKNDFFFTLLKNNHELTFQLMLFYADELKKAENRMRNLAHMTVKGRIADALLMIKNVYGTHKEDGTLALKLKRKELASIAGTTYETTIRTLNELSREKLITVKGKSIALLKEAALRKLCRFE